MSRSAAMVSVVPNDLNHLSGDEITPVAIHRVRHLVDLVEQVRRQTDGDLRLTRRTSRLIQLISTN
jgi:hypothetical protein